MGWKRQILYREGGGIQLKSHVLLSMLLHLLGVHYVLDIVLHSMSLSIYVKLLWDVKLEGPCNKCRVSWEKPF